MHLLIGFTFIFVLELLADSWATKRYRKNREKRAKELEHYWK